ncbi:NAD(P)H-binding protein [Corynebacterium variabile]|uniref:NAD(P)H-binding protein n=1 Tax=Corynebacterium variabile TaxID=1727 RepID=UPI002897CDE7|nr:NAD(P)H-binding protein [Corynebacterium variabile]
MGHSACRVRRHRLVCRCRRWCPRAHLRRRRGRRTRGHRLPRTAARRREDSPRFINVSYLGATHHRVPESDSFFPYADAKKTVDDRLNSTEGLEYLILGPSALTLEPAVGYAIPTPGLPREDSHTSRELVAEIITVFADRRSLPRERTVEFVDGYLPAGEI